MFPILYQSHDLVLYSYPLLMGVGWGVGYQIFFHHSDLSYGKSQLLFWGLFLSSWLGSKLMFILTTQGQSPDLIHEVSFWTGGGFVFYGGLIMASVFLLIWKLAWLELGQKIIWNLLLALTLGHAIGRVGCFLAGCCYGEVTDWPWGIELHGVHRHPTQLIEVLGLFGLAAFLKQSGPAPFSLRLYAVYYGLLRLVVESLRGDEIRGHWGPLTPSQWISILLIFIGFGLSLRARQKLFKEK